MRYYLFMIAIVLSCCLKSFCQTISLVVDNQTPGWLSSKINFEDQQNLKNLKVTGFINGTDIQFIYDLNTYRSLTGVIDFSDVSIVSGGTLTSPYETTIKNDNNMPPSFFYDIKKHIQKFIYPKSLTKAPSLPFQKQNMVDSLIWTSTNVKSLNISNEVGHSKYIYLPEGVESIKQIPTQTHIVIPSTIKKITGKSEDVVILSYIDNPEQVEAKYELYLSTTGTQYWAAISNSTFYIPKGTMEKYLNSDFAKMKNYYQVNMNYYGVDNGNNFIEYYDIDKTEIIVPNLIYKGESHSSNVIIHPDANLVSSIEYKSSNPDIVEVNSDGIIEAKDYGQAVISAIPRLMFNGPEIKIGSCLVKVIAHTEGIEMPSSFTISINEEKTLGAQTLPLGVSDNLLLFESSDPSIASIDDDGMIKGIREGSCTITATAVDGDFTSKCIVTVQKPSFNLTYFVDGVIYKNYNIIEGDEIIIEPAPTKEGYKFSGWSEIPHTMPAYDVLIYGTFNNNLGKCATPTIAFKDGKFKFESEEEGVEFVWNISVVGNSGKGSEVGTPRKYVLSVCATKEFYEDSEPATMEMGMSSPIGDVNGDGVVNAADIATLVDIILHM